MCPIWPQIGYNWRVSIFMILLVFLSNSFLWTEYPPSDLFQPRVAIYWVNMILIERNSLLALCLHFECGTAPHVTAGSPVASHSTLSCSCLMTSCSGGHLLSSLGYNHLFWYSCGIYLFPHVLWLCRHYLRLRHCRFSSLCNQSNGWLPTLLLGRYLGVCYPWLESCTETGRTACE